MYLSKRPDGLKNSGRFYLSSKQSFLQTDKIWNRKNPMGKITISNIMEALIAGTPLENCGKKTNKSQYEKNSA